MERIKQKLHSQSGVSFLFALLAFLVAAMVSVTIVSAAVTSVKRVNSDRENQQEHLTLTSAAQFVRDGMEETKYITKEVTEEYSWNDSTTSKEESASGRFGSEMKTAVQHVNTYQDQYVSGAGSGFQLEITGAEMETVDVTFVMEVEEGSKYKVIFTFSIKDSGERLFLTMNGVVSNSKTTTSRVENGSKKTITTTTTTITWDQPIISGLGG